MTFIEPNPTLATVKIRNYKQRHNVFYERTFEQIQDRRAITPRSGHILPKKTN